jgi:phosphatidylserine synthase
MMSTENERLRLVPKPQFVVRLEATIGAGLAVHPNVLSGLKLLITLPLVLALEQVGVLPVYPAVLLGLFGLFGLLDYLDGVVARNRGLETSFGRFFDRATDYPMLVVLSMYCLTVLPRPLVIAKLLLDLVLMLQYLLGRGTTENRIRTVISMTILSSLLLLSQGWAGRFITPEVVADLLYVGIAFSSVLILFNANLLQKRFIADLLSGVNLVCGIFSMIYASRGRIDVSILFLLIGAACDGCDGAAARKWGGTRWGVYSDDVADGVNYGLAPGVAIFFVLGGIDGLIVGACYSLFTLSRLVFFTLNKAGSDPGVFCGVPSTVGALVALSALLLFPDRLVLVGLLVGVACLQMVSFDTHYRHLGRALTARRRYLFGASALTVLVIVSAFLVGPKAAAGLILTVSLAYGFFPTVAHFARLLRQ